MLTMWFVVCCCRHSQAAELQDMDMDLPGSDLVRDNVTLNSACSLTRWYYCCVSGAGGGAGNNVEQPRTVFQRALEAVALTWDDTHLQAILHGDIGSSYACQGCHSARSMYRHGEGMVSSTCVQHDVAGRLIWTGMSVGAMYDYVKSNSSVIYHITASTGRRHLRSAYGRALVTALAVRTRTL